jgi:choline dehydrogenase
VTVCRLGGSSALNLMLAVRGNKLDYDRWAQVYGAEGWDFKVVSTLKLGSSS